MFSVVCGLCCERRGQKKATTGRAGTSAAHRTAPGSSDDSRGSSRAKPSARPATYLESATQAVHTSFAGLNAEDNSDGGGSDSVSKTLKDLKAIAKRLEGPVQKYPRSGKGIFKKVQERYIAIVPVEGRDRDEHAQLKLWQTGQLAYWESVADFKKGSTPKGGVSLLKVAKVCVSKDDTRGRSVIVKHKSGDDMQELVLCFPTKRDAEEWSYALWEFISMLRGHSSGASFQQV